MKYLFPVTLQSVLKSLGGQFNFNLEMCTEFGFYPAKLQKN